MTLNEFVNDLGLKVFTGEDNLDVPVTGGYCGDLLSWVMGRAKPGDLWITIMNNLNTVAVAVMSDVAAVLMAEGVEPGEGVAQRAKDKGIVLLGSDKPAYELAAAISRKLGE